MAYSKGAPGALSPYIVKAKLNYTPYGKENIQLASLNFQLFGNSGFLNIRLISILQYEKNRGFNGVTYMYIECMLISVTLCLGLNVTSHQPLSNWLY